MRTRAEALTLAVAVCAAAVASALAAVSLARDGLPDTPAASPDAAALVPADALVYVHASLDTGREPVRRLQALADGFPSYAELRDRLVRELASPDCNRATVALRGADDAALSLFVTGGKPVSLLLIEQPPQPTPDRRGCGVLEAENIGPWLAIGQPQALALARRLHDGRSGSLADAPLADAQRDRLPGDRVVDGWLSRDGVRRLLAPQAGVLGLVGTAVDQPRLRGLAFALHPAPGGAALALRTALGAGGRAPSTANVGEIAGRIPSGVMAALAVPRLRSSIDRLSGAAAGASGAGVLGSLPRPVLALFDRPTIVTLTSATPAPVMTVVTTTDDEAAARRTLAAMPRALRRAFPSRVSDGTITLTTRPAGLRPSRAEPLTATEAWKVTIGEDAPADGASLLFLDFSKLLALAEQTGLGTDAGYRAVRADLSRIVAAGLRIGSSASQSTVDLTLQIP